MRSYQIPLSGMSRGIDSVDCCANYCFTFVQAHRIPENVLAAITRDVLQGLASLHRKRMVSKAHDSGYKVKDGILHEACISVLAFGVFCCGQARAGSKAFLRNS